MIKIYLVGFMLGCFSIITTAIFFHFRKVLSQKGFQKYLEVLKWGVWLFVSIFLPMYFMGELLKYCQIQALKPDREIILYIWLIMLIGFIFYKGYISWLKGELKIMDREGKIIYEGRKRKPKSK